MSKIHILSEHLSNRIAAGEAVARELGEEFASALHQLFAALDCILNPPFAVIAGDFGIHGKLLESLVIARTPALQSKIIYRQTGGGDFLLACAMQIQNRYFL